MSGRGSDTINVNPAVPTSVDLTAARLLLQNKHKILLATSMVLVVDYNGHEVSIFKRGRMLIKGVSAETDALRIYNEIDHTIRG